MNALDHSPTDDEDVAMVDETSDARSQPDPNQFALQRFAEHVREVLARDARSLERLAVVRPGRKDKARLGG